MERGESADYALSEDQVRKVLRECPDPKDLALFQCMVFGSLRAGEVAHVRPDWLKKGENGWELSVPPRMDCSCKDCKGRGYWRPKTRAAVRSVHVPDSLARLLLDPDVCHPCRGLGLTRFAVWRRIKALMERLHIRVNGATPYPHALRATCATLMAARGATATAIMYQMGWSDLEVAQRYVQRAQMEHEAKRQARQIFG